jgi:hypothetical protein
MAEQLYIYYIFVYIYVILIIININYVIVIITLYCINTVFLQVTTNTEGRKKK